MNNLTNQRLVSLDAFRGFTIVGMIIVNTPGNWAQVYEPLLHAKWHGITPTDYVFPFFLFIVGVSIVLAFSNRLNAGFDKKQLTRKLVKRAAIIFLLGVFLWLKGQLVYSENVYIDLIQRLSILSLICAFLFYSDDWKIQGIITLILIALSFWWFPEGKIDAIRIPGVLQRIAVVFLACGLLFLNTSWKTQLKLGGGLLVGYWLMMALIPVPVDEVIRQALESGQVQANRGMIDIGSIHLISDSALAANLEPGTNLEAWLDRRLIPFRLFEYSWDPEGVLSTLPSISTGIAGMCIGKILLDKSDLYKKVALIFFFGLLMYSIGGVWKWFFPFNKNLWTSSFVLHTSGLASMALAAMILLIDKFGYKKWAFIGRVFGTNSITAYVLSGMLIFLFYRSVLGMPKLNQVLMDAFHSIGITEKGASLFYAMIYVAIIFLPCYFLYKKKIFLKV